MRLRAEAGRRTDDRADVILGGPGDDNAGGLDGDDGTDACVNLEGAFSCELDALPALGL